MLKLSLIEQQLSGLTTVAEMADSWINGNRRDVARALMASRAVVVAEFCSHFDTDEIESLVRLMESLGQEPESTKAHKLCLSCFMRTQPADTVECCRCACCGVLTIAN